MKKIRIMVALMLILGCCAGEMFGAVSVDAKTKNYYFAGKYKAKFRDGSHAELEMTQSLSGKAERVKGKFSMEYISFTGRGLSIAEGKLTKIGKNKYLCKRGKVRLTFKVYPKKVVVKQKGTSFNLGIYDDFTGTYRLKKRYRF